MVAGSASTILDGAAMLMNDVGTLNGIHAVFLVRCLLQRNILSVFLIDCICFTE